MGNNDEVKEEYLPGISDLDEELVPGVTVSQFLHMSNEERQKIYEILNLTPLNAEQLRGEEITPEVFKNFIKICKKDEGESN